MQGTMMTCPLTLVHILERAGRIFPTSEIVSRRPDRGIHRQTYRDLVDRSWRLAAALRKLGTSPGDRVATLMWNHHAHLECYFGIPCSGAVLHTLNLRLDPRDIAYIAGHAGDRLLVVDDVLLPLYRRVAEHCRFEHVVVVPHLGPPEDRSLLDYEALLADAGPDPGGAAIDENQAAVMCYTSGTTGRPKGVAYSHRSLALHSLAIGLPDVFDFSVRDVAAPVVPMFHVNAWGIPYAATLTGARQVFTGPHLDGSSLLDLFEAEQVTRSAGVPTVWFGVRDAWRAHPGQWRLSPDLMVHIGGASCPPSLLEDLDAIGIRGVHAWGMTETSPVGTVCAAKKDWRDDSGDESDEATLRRRARAGLPIPFVDVRIMSDRGEAPWDDRTMGELQVRGPWIAAAYHDRPDAADRWTADGWFRTGDVACIDADGYVRICDRTKDLVKSGGEWISSVDLENALMAHPSVREAAVIAVPHPKWQERPLACIVPENGVEISADELAAHLAPRFASWWLPDAYVVVDEIPRTSTGKFLKLVLRQRFAEWRWPDG